MKLMLEKLLTTVPDVSDPESASKKALLKSLVTGAYGLGLMLDAVIELDSDLQGARRFSDPAQFMHDEGVRAMCHAGLYSSNLALSKLDYRALLTKLIERAESWSDATVVDLFSGQYGEHARQLAVTAAIDGLNPQWPTSFVATCHFANRHGILRAVIPTLRQAELASSTFRSDGTTDAGKWLDVLVNVQRPINQSQARFEGSYPQYLRMVSASPASQTLADILVEFDPEHGSVPGIVDTAAYAHVMEAVMRRRIDSAVPTPKASQPTAAPSRRNRAL
ncbi:hypothetical protein [Roseateles asaccharophilus]|uniref:hypothetical protein n=1 Tax=Roseateles asaccharophilus TaxID=582607 RepID=UPI00384A7873